MGILVVAIIIIIITTITITNTIKSYGCLWVSILLGSRSRVADLGIGEAQQTIISLSINNFPTICFLESNNLAGTISFNYGILRCY